MLLVLCGMSCSGKTSILKGLVNELGYEPIVTYTSRPMRKNEQDGIDYHFIASEAFDFLEQSDFFVETTSYLIANDEIWKYGTSLVSLQNTTSNGVIILNPEGLNNVSNKIGRDKICICYITADENTILERSTVRGDDPVEVQRRLVTDIKDFENMSNIADIVISNNQSTDLNKIIHDIDEAYNIFKKGK